MGAVKAKKATEGRKGGRGICFTHARAKRFDPGAPARSARLRGRAQARGARVPRRAGAALRARAPRAAGAPPRAPARDRRRPVAGLPARDAPYQDRKSTRLNSSHTVISYAVFCLKKKKKA